MNLIKYDPKEATLGHNDTVWVQPLFSADQMGGGRIAYGCCWAFLKPGMVLEPHKHEMVELYVFCEGRGTMRIDRREFPVERGDSVLIPSNAVHTVRNERDAEEEVAWLSIGVHME